MSAGFVGRHVVDLLDLSTDVFLEVQDQRYSSILYLIDRILLMGFIFEAKSKFSRKSAENLFANILA
jgi:hypothetical protein